VNQELQELIADTLDLPPAEVTETLAREDVDQWDSLSHLRLVTAVEQSFGVRFTMSEIESIDGVPRLLELLAARA